MKIKRASAYWLCLALGVGGFVAGVPACSSSKESADGEFSDVVSTGRLSLALTARGGSGSFYRLRDAVFQIGSAGEVLPSAEAPGSGPERPAADLIPLGLKALRPSLFLFGEDDPLATTLEATLQRGNYEIELLSGWSLEKVTDGVSTRVAATLRSPSMQSFDIETNGETRVSYGFETAGEVIDFGEGRLVVSIEVEEGADGPGGQLGEPLEIVDGLIQPGSNEHDIQAVLYADAAPIGSSIAVGSSTGSICVNGDIAPVIGDDFTEQWGVEFGLAFLSESLLEPAAWDLDGGRVTGFSFVVEGSVIPDVIRFRTADGGGDTGVGSHYCQAFTAGSGHTVEMPFDTLDFQCWNGVEDPFAGDDVLVIAWNIPSDQFASHPFDLCISDLRPVLR